MKGGGSVQGDDATTRPMVNRSGQVNFARQLTPSPVCDIPSGAPLQNKKHGPGHGGGGGWHDRSLGLRPRPMAHTDGANTISGTSPPQGGGGGRCGPLSSCLLAQLAA